MIPKRKKALLTILKAEIKKAQKTAQERRETAKEFRLASRSQQGDRRLHESAADLAESRLSELISFQKDIQKISEQTPKTVNPPCFATLQNENSPPQSFYFVQNVINLTNLQFLTPEAPLGKAILGKKAGEKFSYQIKRENQKNILKGKILKIE